jgi:hypothetical protein
MNGAFNVATWNAEWATLATEREVAESRLSWRR